MTLKEKINMHLDLYTNELSTLIAEAHSLYEKISSRPSSYWSKNRSEHKAIMNQITSIQSKQEALEQCKNDCIKNL